MLLKSALIVIAMIFTSVAFAGMDCRAEKIYDTSFFEESFSVEEYPEVIIDEKEARIGANYFSPKIGNKIELNSNYAPTEATIWDEAEENGFYVELVPHAMTAKLYAFYAGDSEDVLVADLLCNE